MWKWREELVGKEKKKNKEARRQVFVKLLEMLSFSRCVFLPLLLKIKRMYML